MKFPTMPAAGAALAAVSLMFSTHASANDDKMQMMDTNKDGVISAAEHAAGARQMYSKMDANGDGSLSAAELQTSHSDMKSDRAN
jgi:hypothetical protein